MIRTLVLTTALATTVVALPLAPGSVSPTLAASHSAGEDATAGDGPMREIPQGVILATSVIGMPTFLKGDEAAAGPIGRLVDAIVGLDGTIRGVVIRTPGGRALAVPAERLEQGRIAGAPVLFIDITRQQADDAPDLSEQLPGGGNTGTTVGGTDPTGTDSGENGTGTAARPGTDGEPMDMESDAAADDGTADEQTGVTGTTIDGTDATGADSGENGTGTEGRAGTDGEPMDMGDGASGDGTTDDGEADDATAGEQTGVTGTTIDGTDATGADSGENGTGTAARAGTDGEPLDMDGEEMDGEETDNSTSN